MPAEANVERIVRGKLRDEMASHPIVPCQDAFWPSLPLTFEFRRHVLRPGRRQPRPRVPAPRSGRAIAPLPPPPHPAHIPRRSLQRIAIDSDNDGPLRPAQGCLENRTRHWRSHIWQADAGYRKEAQIAIR